MEQTVRINIPLCVAMDFEPMYEGIDHHGLEADPAYPTYEKVRMALKSGKKRVFIQASVDDLFELKEECELMLMSGGTVADEPGEWKLRNGYRRLLRNCKRGLMSLDVGE